MDLNILWFVLIGVLYTVYFVLEGFDFGVGILLPWLGKTDLQRRQIINTIGPHWDGNEVWLITAGGATFAAFPQWYATLFSGFYLPLFLLLVALILRGIAFEFRSKDDNPRWRSLWDGCIFAGSLVASLLLGVTFSNLVRGVPIDANMHYTGGFFNLLNLYALVGGITTVLSFILHGAIFLTLKLSGDLAEKAHRVAQRTWPVVVAAMVILLAGTYLSTDFLKQLGVDPGFVPLTGLVALFLSGYFLRSQQNGWAFVCTTLSIAGAIITCFTILFHRVMISSTNPDWSLTIYNASSSQYTLSVMAIVALILVPIVLVYQVWSYRVFRHRVAEQPEKLTY